MIMSLRTALVAVSLTVSLTAACTDDLKARLDDDWQQMMECSAYFTLRAMSARESQTAASQRAADSAHADARLALEYSHALGDLAGRPMADTDARLRELGAELLDDIDADLSHIGLLRTSHEDRCRATVAEGDSRIEYWRNRPQG